MIRSTKEFVHLIFTGKRDRGVNRTQKFMDELDKQSKLVTNMAAKVNSKIEEHPLTIQRTSTYYIAKGMGVVK